jgi:tetratricopeptide (TPR) repeat protein
LLELYLGLAVSHERKGELEDALATNAKYLRLARKISSVDSCSYGAGLSNLSSIYYSLENYEKAIENSMKARSIRSFAAIESDMHKARVLNEIGLI